MSSARSIGQALLRASPRTTATVSTASRAVLPALNGHPATRTVSASLEHRSFFSQRPSLQRQSEQNSVESGSTHPAEKSASHSGYGNADEGPTSDKLSDTVGEENARDHDEGNGQGKDEGKGEVKTKSKTDSKSGEKQNKATKQQSNGESEAGASDQDPSLHVMPDGIAEGDARGRTGGGKPLDSSKNAPPQPKILNASMPGDGESKLTKEQQAEVDKHNKEFEKSFDHAAAAPEDKVDKKFWTEKRASD